MTLIITSDITGAIMHAYEAVKQAHQLLTSLQQRNSTTTTAKNFLFLSYKATEYWQDSLLHTPRQQHHRYHYYILSPGHPLKL